MRAAGHRSRTVLQSAAESGHMNIVKLLLSAGADVNAEPADDGGGTALRAAAGEGHLDIVKLLLEAGADVNAEPKGRQETALQVACFKGYLNIVQMLINAGADVNAKPTHHYQNKCALQAAAANGHSGIVEML
ncbi:ankyrin, partial [Trichoderma citrinoviride]